jgi:hypothetical protein|tara:strand:+ start:13380 stop:13760 length:381 start_codon:yes stop_codon:yes gene_type:complete
VSCPDRTSDVSVWTVGSANDGAVAKKEIGLSDSTPAANTDASATRVHRTTASTSTSACSVLETPFTRFAHLVDVDGLDIDVDATRRGVSLSRQPRAAQRGAWRTHPAVTSVCACIMEWSTGLVDGR